MGLIASGKAMDIQLTIRPIKIKSLKTVCTYKSSRLKLRTRLYKDTLYVAKQNLPTKQ